LEVVGQVEDQLTNEVPGQLRRLEAEDVRSVPGGRHRHQVGRVGVDDVDLGARIGLLVVGLFLVRELAAVIPECDRGRSTGGGGGGGGGWGCGCGGRGGGRGGRGGRRGRGGGRGCRRRRRRRGSSRGRRRGGGRLGGRGRGRGRRRCRRGARGEDCSGSRDS